MLVCWETSPRRRRGGACLCRPPGAVPQPDRRIVPTWTAVTAVAGVGVTCVGLGCGIRRHHPHVRLFVHWSRRNPWVLDLGVIYGAGDENRTRTLSLGSDGAWVSATSLTCADVLFLRWS